MKCARCGAPLSHDEEGLTRKLVSRGAKELYCYACLGVLFKATRKQLEEMVRAFREAGCTLFL